MMGLAQCFTDLVAASPAILLLIIIDSEEVTPACIVLHPSVVKLVGAAVDVILEPSELHLSALITTARAGGGVDHNPGQQCGPGGC